MDVTVLCMAQGDTLVTSASAIAVTTDLTVPRNHRDIGPCAAVVTCHKITTEDAMEEVFSVTQFFHDGTYETVRSYVPAIEAMKAFNFYRDNVAARMGITVRVIITDGGDCVAFEWVRGKGIVYPPQYATN